MFRDITFCKRCLIKKNCSLVKTLKALSGIVLKGQVVPSRSAVSNKSSISSSLISGSTLYTSLSICSLVAKPSPSVSIMWNDSRISVKSKISTPTFNTLNYGMKVNKLFLVNMLMHYIEFLLFCSWNIIICCPSLTSDYDCILAMLLGFSKNSR